MLTVREVNTGPDLDRFVRLPFRIYEEHPNWVPPLVDDVKNTLTPGRNPFWAHAERKLFLAEQDGLAVGRIAAIIDRNYNEYHHSAIGFFGFFESVDDAEVAGALLEAASRYCREHGMSTLYGPANPSLNDEAGLLVDGFDSPPMIRMPYNPEHYIQLIEGAGFTKVKDLYAFLMSIDRPVPEKLQRVMERLKKKPGLEVRPVNLAHLDRDLAYIREVYNDAWSQNWDFAPMTEEEIAGLAQQLRPIIVPGLCPLVFYRGEVAGMCVGLPDYNQVLWHLKGNLFPFGWLKFLTMRRRITQGRLWALGVKRKFHNLGFDSLLYYEAFMTGRKLGYTRGEMSWILEDNIDIIRPIEMWGGRVYKTYRIYQKSL